MNINTLLYISIYKLAKNQIMMTKLNHQILYLRAHFLLHTLYDFVKIKKGLDLTKLTCFI